MPSRDEPRPEFWPLAGREARSSPVNPVLGMTNDAHCSARSMAPAIASISTLVLATISTGEEAVPRKSLQLTRQVERNTHRNTPEETGPREIVLSGVQDAIIPDGSGVDARVRGLCTKSSAFYAAALPSV